MLDNPNSLKARGERRPGLRDSEVTWSLQEARIILRKYGWMIAVIAGAFIAVAFLYSVTATRQYTAVARLLIDTPRGPLSAMEGSTGAGGGGGGLNVPEVESQLQVIQSDRIGLKVVQAVSAQASLAADAKKPGFVEFLFKSIVSIPRNLLALVTAAEPVADLDPEREALNKIMAGLNVRRLGSSYVLEISYTSPVPQMAADVANGFANAYVQDEIDSKAQIWKRASLWLQDRVNELRARSEEAARAAQDFKAQNGNNAETWPKVRELDRTAEAYDALYSAFLKRYTDSVQQQTFPITQARIISEAARPISPSRPLRGMIIGLAAVLGLGLGTAVAFTRWSFDRTIRSPAQIARYGIRCLTTLPRLPKVISRDATQVIRTVMRAPRSQFTENLRLVRAEISIVERQRPMRYIGITSALSGEGKTTIAGNLAQLFAATGPTLLVDADMRNPQLTKALTPILAPRTLDNREPPWPARTASIPGCPGLSFLGLDQEQFGAQSNWFEQGGFEAMLEENKQKYSRIIVDLPPAGVVAEARYVAPLLDAIIVVVEWESTPEEAFMACIDACDVEPGKVFGVILNKAHPGLLVQSQGSPYSNNYFEQEDEADFVDLRKGRIRV
ncbi:MAG: hypothetical protein JWM36_1116 [Hyphomicrobiales bacterium]|nr:hypothetical protein [Hyphomicrobiales bacterium]